MQLGPGSVHGGAGPGTRRSRVLPGRRRATEQYYYSRLQSGESGQSLVGRRGRVVIRYRLSVATRQIDVRQLDAERRCTTTTIGRLTYTHSTPSTRTLYGVVPADGQTDGAVT